MRKPSWAARVVSYWRTRRRWWLIHPLVRSTTQRWGWTMNPPTGSSSNPTAGSWNAPTGGSTTTDASCASTRPPWPPTRASSSCPRSGSCYADSTRISCSTRFRIEPMVRYVVVHPHDPQPRLVEQVVALLRDGALIAYPTDSCYALGARMDSHDGADRIRRIRHLGDRHHFTLVCADFAQIGQYVLLDNVAFRAIKASTPGPYTFILPATKEVPRRLAHPRKRTVGVRIVQHPVAAALVRELGEPLLSSTLLLPGQPEGAGQ